MHRAAGWPYCREANGCVSRVFLPPIARVEEYVYPPARHRRHSPATRAGVINVIEGEAGSIARADVADFCIGAILEKDFPYRSASSNHRVESRRWRHGGATEMPSTQVYPKNAVHLQRRRHVVGEGP